MCNSKETDVSATAAPNRNKDAEDKASINENMARIAHKIIVLSGKGGVGKSTVAVNLAVSLAEKKFKTGLLDIDIHGPSVPKLLGIDGGQVMGARNGKMTPVEYNECLKVISIGFLLQDNDTAVIWRGPMKYTVIKQFLADVDWGNLDYLIVDSPPGTGDEPLSICQLIENADGAVVVTTPQDVALIDVRKSVNFYKQLHMPVIGVIENMSGFTCPHCGKETDIFKNGGGKKMAEDMGVPYLGEIPIESHIVASGDSGNPFHVNNNAGETPAHKSFSGIINTILHGAKK
ncbi:MAG TPA: Mrp/NBP35 family ATP-binding protein [Spirochaetota bacterium]|nr:Mrp/NBP35 family ATP-binding protein [Spirochaetota bacterium]